MKNGKLIRSGSIEVNPADWGNAWMRHHRAIVLMPKPGWCPQRLWTWLTKTIVRDEAWQEQKPQTLAHSQADAALLYNQLMFGIQDHVSATNQAAQQQRQSMNQIIGGVGGSLGDLLCRGFR